MTEDWSLVRSREDAMRKVASRVDYDPATGIFTWKQGISKIGGAGRPGGIAGSYDKDGYRRLKYLKHAVKAHALAWFLTYGRLPAGMIDHINRVRDDNRIANLRVVSPSGNNQNRGPQVNNTTGYSGVIRSGRKYISNIVHRRQRIYLGTFETAESAYEAYLAAKRVYHKEGFIS